MARRSTQFEAVGVEPYVAQYAALKDRLPGAAVPWLAELRETGLQHFAERGFPTHKVEAWKYTTLRPLAGIPFTPSVDGAAGVGKAELPRLLTDDAAPHRVVFVNSRFRPELSEVGSLPAGVRLGGLAEILAAEPGLLEPYLGAAADAPDKPMLALNTALMTDGVVLLVDAGVVVERPIEITFVAVAGAESPAFYPRNLIVARAGAQATVVENHVGLGEGSYLVNGATNVLVEDGATLHHYKLQDEGQGAYHLYFNQVRLERAAVYDSFVLSTGGKLARNQIEVVLDGSDIDCHLNGAYMARGRQLLDHTSVIEHAKPCSRSRQVYKGVLDEQARGVFQGQIVVDKDAQKTDGHQLNRALLLSEGAEIDSKPMLEIYADDVKCSHGATAGDLDDNALFYLRARGIPEKEARGLLIGAFLREVIDDLPVAPVREAFGRRVDAWLKAGTER